MMGQKIDEWKTVCDNFKFPRYVVLGTGGSSLGAQALCASLDTGNINFIENIDSFTFDSFFAKNDIENIGFIVISKSGNTAETMAQFSVCYGRMRGYFAAKNATFTQADVSRHFLVVTTKNENPLHKLSQDLGIMVVPHEPDVGGRFSCFTNVSMIPFMLAGGDVHAFFDGAAAAFRDMDFCDGAAFAHDSLKNRSMHCLMVYSDRLTLLSSWFKQLWAESLGKDGIGSTPITALGTVDQHSQLQLFADGPDDKIYTFIMLDNNGKGDSLDSSFELPESFDYFRGKRMGDLMEAEQGATYTSLSDLNRPLRAIRFDDLSAFVYGWIMAYFVCEVMLVASLMGVDAFSQPGVESSKILTRKYLSV